METIQSTLVPLELSFDGGTSWQLLVCLSQYNIPLSKAVNTVETFCGTSVGLGNGTFNPQGTAIAELNPTAGVQVSWPQLATVWDAETQIMFRARYPTGGSTGNNIFLKGSCYVTDLNISFQVGQAVQFDFTLTGQGELDITNP